MRTELGVLSRWTLAIFVGALAARADEPRVVDPSALDRGVDPCVDFYTYSCGGWLKQNPIPPDQSRWSAYSKLQDETRQQLKQLLEESGRGGAKRTPEQQ